MKLFIATTSRNFDAIVSTDSVSPASFYTQRGFGISLFYDKASFILPNSILLTDVFPSFSINRDEVDHRPMVIEIDSSSYPGFFEEVKNGGDYKVYRTDRTLYLSPISCRIFFFSESDKYATLSKAKPIVEAKFIAYDRLNAIRVLNNRGDTIKIGQETFKRIEDNPVLNSESIKEDIRINKAKGFLVSYLIGADMAITPESARLLRLAKDIKNGVYSLGTKEDKTKEASRSIYRLAEEADYLSESLDPKKIQARSRMGQYLSSLDATALLHGSSIEEILLFLEKAGLYHSLLHRLAGGGLVSVSALSRSAITSQEESSLEKSLSDIQKYAYSIAQKSGTIECISDLISFEKDLTYIKCKDKALDQESREKVEIMYSIFSGYNYRAANIRENRVDYIIDAGKGFFSVPTDENQEERNYINAMLDNLEHAASFDINSTGSTALQSLAVFMRSPDADLDKMLSLIVSNEIADARIAFGLWGLFYGYSNIPQSYYNQLVSNLKADIFISHIHSLLFGKVPEYKEDTISTEHSSFLQKTLSVLGIGDKKQDKKTRKEPRSQQVIQGDLFSDIGDRAKEESPVEVHSSVIEEQLIRRERMVDRNDTISNDISLSEEDDLPGFDHVYKALSDIIVHGFTKREQIEYYRAEFFNLCVSASSYSALKNGLDNIPIKEKTATNWKKVKSELKKRIGEMALQESIKEAEKKRQFIMAEVSAGLATRQFVSDREAWTIIKPLLPNDEEVRRQMEKDLTWFQDNYKSSHIEKGRHAYYADKPRDNASVISNYERYLKNKQEYNPSAQWLHKIYLKVDVTAIISALKKIYR